MNITLTPQRRDDTLTVSKQGDTLKINGQTFDFTGMPDGSTLPAEAVACEYIRCSGNKVERIDGELRLTLLLPHGADATQAALFPAPLINPPDGSLELPQ
jgi:hypothetical protein